MKKFFQRLFGQIAGFFVRIFGKAKEFLKKEIPTAIKVVEQIKYYMDGPVLPLINALIPGEVDNIISAKIKAELPKILVQLKIAEECAGKATNDQIVQCAIDHLKKYHPEAQKAYFLNIAAMLSKALVDGKLSTGEIIVLVQYTYDTKFKKA
jgi:hypothetical protein